MRKPKRLFRTRSPSPDFPSADVATLRRARGTLDPFRTYRLRMPDGSTFETTGADMIATGEAMAGLLESINRGDDPRVIMAAFERLDRTL
jgi:hypothetical protein